jgi:hypothetical protein
VKVSFSGRQFVWTFLLAAVDFAIIGADFLKQFGLVVDLSARRLLDTASLQCFPAEEAAVAPSSGGSPYEALAATPAEFRSLFREFQDVANQAGIMPPARHSVVHHIVTEGPPATARFWRLDPAKLAAAKQDFAKLEKGHHPQVFKQLVIAPPHGDEGGWYVEALW